MEKVSQRVKTAREAKGITIEELSKATLISHSVIEDIESGKFDKYKGDEQYVKMYLKKLAAFLDIDPNELADQYIELTQEIQLKDLQKMEEEKVLKEQENSTTFVDKMGDTFKNIQISKPIKPTTKRGVYEDHFVKRYMKYVLVGLLVVAIICVVWYAYVSTSNDSSSNFDNTTSSVEGNVNDSSKQDTQDEKDDEEEPKKQEATPTVELTKNAPMDFNFKLPADAATFKVKIEFVGRTWASLSVNDQTYTDFESRIYNNENTSNSMEATPETVELEFSAAEFNTLSLRLGYNRGHRYYINDQQVPIEDSEYNDTNKTFKLTLVK